MKAKRLIALVLSLVMLLTAFGTVSMSAIAEEADPDLLLNFDFNDFINGAITDTTGNVTVYSSNGVAGGFNSDESAMYFNGADDGTFTWLASDYDPFAQSENGITITMWVKPETLTGWDHLFNYGNSVNGFSGNYVFIQQQDGKGVRINTSFNDVNYDNKQIAQNLTFGFDQSCVGVWTMLTFTEDGAGNWKVYQDNALAATWNGSEAGAYSLYEIHNQVEKVDEDRGSDGASYSLLAPQRALWDGSDNGFHGAVQSLSIYKGEKTADEIAAMYNVKMAADQDAVDNVETLIAAAKAAEAGTDAQIAAYKVAKAAYDALNSLEKALVENGADLEAVKESYIATSGVILGFDFDENFEDILGRIELGTTDGYATLEDGAMVLSGDDIGDWTKICGFDHRNYRVFDQVTGDATIELKINANSYVNNAIFSVTWGWHQYLILQGANDDKLQLRFREQIDGVDQTAVVLESAPNVLKPGEWQTISLVQTKGESSTKTEVYVDGICVITADSQTDLVKGLTEMDFSHDDMIMVGSSDLGNSESGRNLFSGMIDSCYIYNYAKGFEADYSKVDEAIAATEELDADDYTADSWQALQDAITAVDRTLTLGQQDIVDGYADAINEAAANLISKDLEMNIAISDGVATASDKGDSYKNITWNATITLGDSTDLDALNVAVTFKEYGVIYGMNDSAVQLIVAGEETKLAKKVAIDSAEGEEGIDVYTAFGFRLKGAPTTADRSAMFYVTYEANGQTYTIYSPMGDTPAAE